MPGRGNRLTQADREAWAGFARHIAPLPGRTPQSVLARMPGIHITVAVAWQRASAGD